MVYSFVVFALILVRSTLGHNFTYEWTVPEDLPTNTGWQAVTCGYDGIHCVAATYFGDYSNYKANTNYYTSDGGLSWKESSPKSVSWHQLISSKSGQYVLGTDGWFSSDYGASFALLGNLPSGARSIAMTSDATHVFVVDNSTEYKVHHGEGTTPGDYSWSELSVPTATTFREVSCSGDGQYVFVACGSGELYVSTNFGATWTLASELSANKYTLNRVITSLDGKVSYVMAYAKQTGGTFPLKSQDYGTTWNYTGFPAALYVSGFTTNEDGSMFIVSEDEPNGLLISNDYGENFAFTNINQNKGIGAIWVSPDGSKMIAGAGEADSYYGTWSLNIGVGTDQDLKKN